MNELLEVADEIGACENAGHAMCKRWAARLRAFAAQPTEQNAQQIRRMASATSNRPDSGITPESRPVDQWREQPPQQGSASHASGITESIGSDGLVVSAAAHSVLAKPIHKAKLVSAEGDVSPLCAKKPNRLDLRTDSWSQRWEAVTCTKCLALKE